MNTLEPLDDDEIDIEPQLLGETKLLQEQLEARCKIAKIPFEKVDLDEYGKACKIGLPCARERRWVYCWSFTDYQRLLSIPFEQYTFLHGLDAICNYSSNSVEATIKTLGTVGTRSIYTKIFGIPQDELADRAAGAFLHLEAPNNESNATITLGNSSTELLTLVPNGVRQRFSLTISSQGMSQHDQVLDLLRRTADALFFQIDLVSNILLTLARERKPIGRRPLVKRPEPASAISFPTHEYDSAPVSLYWYARSAIGMPLLQFLAYYQVIEFYFPTYSQAEARRRIKTILKDPTFRGDRDADLGRLLSAIHVTRSGGVGDERSQLRATIMECVDEEGLRDFLTSDNARKEFLSSKAKGLADHKIPVANSSADLRADVAERIYEIRCKIVHTKVDAKHGELELLLPFSKESEQLSFDIELVQFVAQKILISASTPFKF